MDKSSLNVCLTFSKSDLEIQYHNLNSSHMQHISCFHWHSLRLYWHATIMWWCLTETALHEPFFEIGSLALHILNIQYVILTAFSHFKPRHAYFMQNPTIFLTSYGSLKLLKTSWRSDWSLNLLSIAFLRKIPVVILLRVKVLHRCSAFWWLLAEQTNLLDNILCIEIVEHVKLLLCNWW